ncbi:DUF177 domain-containing protein [bacterium]|nr:DUF177 domain-containing protein [bacterium]
MTIQKYRDLVIPVAVLDDNRDILAITWSPGLLSGESGITFPEDVHVEIKTDKVDGGYLVNVKATGRVALICDRCGTDFLCPVTGEVRSFYTYTAGTESGDDIEVHVISTSTRKIDLSQDALDALFMGLPVKGLCIEECKGLCDICGANLNLTECHCSRDEIDPRWEALKGLRLDEE